MRVSILFLSISEILESLIKTKFSLQRYLRGLIALFFLTMQAACQSPTGTSPTSPIPSAPTIEISLPTDPFPTATLVLQMGLPISQTGEITYLEAPTPVADPLQFIFPTPAPPPVSAWRPPLYPTPWVPTQQDHFYFARPIGANEINWPLPDYRYGGVFLPDVVHTGIDIPAPIGTPVVAAGSGRVVWAGYGLYQGSEDITDPYGLAVAIRHDFGYQGDHVFTVYGHLSQVDVVRGQQVVAGELLGLSGETGNVTGPHLHFEVRIGRNNFSGSRNPELWLAPPQGWGILAGRVMTTTGYPLLSQEVTVKSRDTGQNWTVITYGKGAINSDPYYNENLVIGDLPAGDYQIWIPFAGTTYNLDIQISPGMVSYFTFKGRNGYKTNLPPTPTTDFALPAETISPPIP